MNAFLRVVVKLPKASQKDEYSKGWYARLSLKVSPSSLLVVLGPMAGRANNGINAGLLGRKYTNSPRLF